MISTSLRGILAPAVWLAISSAATLQHPAFAQERPSGERTLTLKGEGTAHAMPDLAWLRIGVETQASQAREALDANSGAMSKVLAALKSDGLADKDVQTSNFSIMAVYSDDPKKPRVVTGYSVGNQVTARIRDLPRTGEIIDQVVALGSNDIASVSFNLDDPTAAWNEARADAVRDAIAKSKLYASAAGVELGPILRIVEEPTGNFAPAARQFATAAVGAAPPIESGEITFRASVDITWSLK
jgi:hypothetical protein